MRYLISFILVLLVACAPEVQPDQPGGTGGDEPATDSSSAAGDTDTYDASGGVSGTGPEVDTCLLTVRSDNCTQLRELDLNVCLTLYDPENLGEGLARGLRHNCLSAFSVLLTGDISPNVSLAQTTNDWCLRDPAGDNCTLHTQLCENQAAITGVGKCVLELDRCVSAIRATGLTAPQVSGEDFLDLSEFICEEIAP